MFRKLLIAGALISCCILGSCNTGILPVDTGSDDGGNSGGVNDPDFGENPIRARVRNESDVQVDVTLRFLADDEVVHLAFVRVPPDTMTTIAGPKVQAIELSGVNETGGALSSARLTFGVDFDEARAAEYVVRRSNVPPDDEPPHPVPPGLTLDALSKESVLLGETLEVAWSDNGSPSAVVSFFLRPAGDEDALLVAISPAIGAALDGLNDSFVAVVEGIVPGEYEVVGRIDDGDQSLFSVAPGTILISRDAENAAPTISFAQSTGTVALRNGDPLTISWTDADSDDNATIVFALTPVEFGVLGSEEFVISPPIAENPDKQPADSVTVTLRDVLPGLYDLTARIDDGRLAGTDRVVEAVRVVPATPSGNEIPRLNLLKPDADFEISKAGSFVVRWTDSDANDNARISLLLDSDSQSSLLNGNEFLLATALDEDPDGASDQTTLVVPLDVPSGMYRLVSVISDGLTQVITRAPALITVRGSGGGSTTPGNGGGDGGGDGTGDGSGEITLVPDAYVIDRPGELITVVITHEFGPVPRRSRVFFSNEAYGGTFVLDVTPIAGPAPTSKTYSIVIDSGLVPNNAWPRSFDIVLETIVDGVTTTTRSTRPIWIRQEVEVLELRAINYICEQGDTIDDEPTPFVGVEWTWYGGGTGTGDEMMVAFWLSADGVIPANGREDSTHQLMVQKPGSPNQVRAERIELDTLLDVQEQTIVIVIADSLGLDSDWYWLIPVYDPDGENLQLPAFSRPVRVCPPVDASIGDTGP